MKLWRKLILGKHVANAEKKNKDAYDKAIS